MKTPMSGPAVFFDRDNTLIVTDGYLGDPDGVVLVPGAAEAVARARRLGYVSVVFSNQSGVARGLFDEQAVRRVNRQLDELLQQQDSDAIIEHHEFCPYHPEAVVEEYRRDSDLRKPRPGMILRAAAELDLDLPGSWVIGDAPRDIAAGHAAGCRTILVTDADLPPSPAASAESDVQPDYTARRLNDALDIIEQHTMPRSRRAAPDKPPRSDVDPPISTARIEELLGQVLDELRRRNRHAGQEFSVSKLLAGIVQVTALAILVLAYFQREQPQLQSMLLLALVLQTLTIALLIMGWQK
jgi:D,D-heptose 1,7-bisphosphate phosphatase